MARPVKDGLDYFSLDTHFLTNTKIKKLKLKHGYIYVLYYLEMLATIYREKGYYAESENIELAIMDEFRIGESEAKLIIKNLVEIGLFDKKMYDKFNITTSKGIQEQFVQVAQRRKEKRIKKEFNLIELSEYYIKQEVNVDKNGVNVDKNGVNVCEKYTKERKGKERKGKETKEEREDRNKEIISNKEIGENQSPHALISYGKFNNVFLKETEYENLKATYQDYKKLIDRLSCYLANSRRDYDNHYALLIKFAVDDGYVKKPKIDITDTSKEQESKGTTCPKHIMDKIKRFNGKTVPDG